MINLERKKDKFVIPKQGGMQIPVELFVNKNLMPNDNTLSKLIKMSTVDGVYNKIVALPDIHYKFNTSFRFSIPTGTVALCKDAIVPKFINPDCGMLILTTNLKNLSENDMDKVFRSLKSKVSVSMRKRPIVNDEDLNLILIDGVKWAFEKYGFDNHNIDNVYDYKDLINYNKDLWHIKSILPKQYSRIGKLSLGILGTGNHFIEMQRIDKILDKKLASKFNVEKGQIVFMLHMGSMFFGDLIHDYYSSIEKNKAKLPFLRKIYWNLVANEKLKILYRSLYKTNLLRKKITGYINSRAKNKKTELKSLNVNKKIVKDYITAKKIATLYGIVNRLTLAKLIENSLKEHFDNANTSILIDLNHDSIFQEKIDNDVYYVHRYGANRAHPKSLLKNNSKFKKTGQLLMIPGSMGDYSYIGVADEGSKNTFYSANHGAGRTLDKVEARNKFNLEKLDKEIKNFNVKLYRYKVGDIVEEIPSAFKSINEVIDVMKRNKIAKPIVRLKPVAVLKGN